jgi:RNA polymerase sigma-54 factor
MDRDSLFENASDPGFASRSSSNDDSKRMFIEGAIARSETLQEHLLWQLRLQPLDEERRSIGESLIQNLDDDGFHKEDPFLLCSDKPEGLVREMMREIQGFEPVGTWIPLAPPKRRSYSGIT